jgi:hypothetical protein
MEEQEATLVRISERLQQLLVPVEPPLAYVRSLWDRSEFQFKPDTDGHRADSR